MEIHSSARRHLVVDDDMRHAVEHALAVEDSVRIAGPMIKRTHGHTKSGAAITDEMVEKFAADAEHGYDVDALVARRNKRGRPRLGTEPSSVESVRLDPELKALLVRRAEDEGVPVSEVIREALREHLETS